MTEEEIELPLYPYVRAGRKRGPGTTKLSVMDSRSGEELAWWIEGAGHVDNQTPRKYIKPDPDLPPKSHPQQAPAADDNKNLFDPTSVFITCLDVRTKREHIYSHFITLGDIERVTKLKSKANGQFTGSAYVQFSSVHSAQEALYLNGSYLNGATIMVQRKLKNNKNSTEEVQGSGTAIKLDVSATTEVKPLNCVIVKNFDPSMTQLDVASHFQTAGDIKSVSVSEISPSNFEDVAVAEAEVEFKEPSFVSAALRLNGSVLGSNKISVERKCPLVEQNNNVISHQSKKSPHLRDSNSIFIGNMEPHTSELDLTNHFSGVGKIQRVTILKDMFTGQQIPAAYIQFKHPQSVMSALKLHGSYLRGNMLSVRRKMKAKGRSKQN